MFKTQEIDINLIDRPENIARLEIDESKIRELAASIEEKGLQQPIGVTPRDGRYLIVFGDRRFLAYRMLGRETITCSVIDADDHEVLQLRTIENVQRVNLSPMEEALQYRVMVEKLGMTIDQISKKTGKNPGTITRRLSVLEMPESFQIAIHKGLTSIGVCEELMRVKDPGRREYYLQLAVEHGITSKTARFWVDQYKKEQAAQRGGVDEGGRVLIPYDGRRTYLTCDMCGGPSEVKETRSITVCSDCFYLIADLIPKTRQ